MFTQWIEKYADKISDATTANASIAAFKEILGSMSIEMSELEEIDKAVALLNKSKSHIVPLCFTLPDTV